MSNYSMQPPPNQAPPTTGPSSVGPQHQDFMDISMMPMDKSHQTMMWQQNQYLSDSGIHSALGTHTPSVSSKQGPEDMEHDEAFLNPALGSQQSQQQQQSWSNGPLSGYQQPDMCMMSPGTPGGGSCVLGGEAMADGGAMIPNPNNGSANCGGPVEIDADIAACAIPDLVKLIKDEDDPVIINQASMMVYQLSKSEAIDALITCRDMLECIISALDRSDDPETVRFLAGTLYNMSQKRSGLEIIFAARSVPCLVNLLNSPVESVLFYAITTLHNLLLHQEGAKMVIRQSGCLQKMVTLLQKNNIKFLAICTDCLQILAYGHQESKLAILAGGGPKELVRILRTYQYEKLLWTTTRVLKVLSVCSSNKPAIIDAGGMEALAGLLHQPSQRLVHNCLWTLRNLSDAATKLDNLHGLLQGLVQLLGSSDANTVTCGAGILSNLTCNNQKNKLIVCKFGGIEALLHTLSEAGDRDDILEPCVCALRHLTSRHEEAEAAQNSVRLLNGLPVIARVLATSGEVKAGQPGWALVKAVVGLLRNLALCPANHTPMRERGLVASLMGLLCRTQQDISKISVSGQQPPGGPTVVQGVRLEEVVEGTCGALHMLARESATRLVLVRGCPTGQGKPPAFSNTIGIFVQLLFSSHEAIQRVAAGVLFEIAQEREGLEAIASTPAGPQRIAELVHSRSEGIATYATAVMFRLSEERKGVGHPQHMMMSQQPQGSLSAMLGPPPPDPYVQASQHQQPYAPDGYGGYWPGDHGMTHFGGVEQIPHPGGNYPTSVSMETSGYVSPVVSGSGPFMNPGQQAPPRPDWFHQSAM